MKDTKILAELAIEATLENVDKVVDFVEKTLEDTDISMKIKMTVNIAVDEIVSNVARYAYHPDTGTVEVKIATLDNGKLLELTFIDSGVPYDPLKTVDPDTTLSAEEREIGGLGIFIVKKSMDEMEYEYKEGKNILKLRKKIN